MSDGPIDLVIAKAESIRKLTHGQQVTQSTTRRSRAATLAVRSIVLSTSLNLLLLLLLLVVTTGVLLGEVDKVFHNVVGS